MNDNGIFLNNKYGLVVLYLLKDCNDDSIRFNLNRPDCMRLLYCEGFFLVDCFFPDLKLSFCEYYTRNMCFFLGKKKEREGIGVNLS